MRHFRFDPFSRARPRASARSGALRAGATDVDTAPRSVGTRKAKMTKATDLLTAGPRRA